MRNSRYSLLTWFLGLAVVIPTLPTEAGNAVPVLIWGGGEDSGSLLGPVNPLHKTSQVDFEKILTKKVGGSQRPILVFVRENLCVEDFTQHKEGLMHLKDDGSLIYLPAVDSPLLIFESLPLYNQTQEEDLETVVEGQVAITKATDLDAVFETFNMVKESSPNLIAALIGKSCLYSRSERTRRAVDEPNATAPKEEDLVVKTERILLYSSSAPTLNITEIGESKSSSSKLISVTQKGNGTSWSPLALDFSFSVENATSPFTASIILELNMNSTSYYTAKAYYQDNEKLVRLTTQSYFVFPYNVSYHCSGSVRFYQKMLEVKNQKGIDFVIDNFQIQVDPKNSTFNYAFDCVGFTTAPIWSGLFVTLILGLIMIWGLIMIMDIRTMDRFDDPKGKTITVTASE